MNVQLTSVIQPPIPDIVLCLDCDEPIHSKRLEAQPQAKFCIKCQPNHDKAPDPSITEDPETMKEMARNYLGGWSN